MENSTDATNSQPPVDQATRSGDMDTEKKNPPTPLRCFTGALTAAGISLLAYRLTLSIAESFANHPISATNQMAASISAAVRTLVTGMAALGTGVFGVAALGLAGLGIQLLVQGGITTEAK